MQNSVLTSTQSVPSGTDDCVLQAEELTKEFSGFVAVRGVNLKVRRHTIHALIGPNGAGKTTCFNLLTKFVKPTSGRIFYNGIDITGASPESIAGQGLVRSFQISAIFPKLSPRENVRVALQRKLGTTFHFWKSVSSLRSLNAEADCLLDAVGLKDGLDRPASELSYGRKRALEIATTLALDPQVMLLDEPMAGMGREDIDAVADLIQKVAVGRTVLMVEHNLGVVARLADTITVLRRGEILDEGKYEAVARNPEVVAAYLGAAHV